MLHHGSTAVSMVTMRRGTAITIMAQFRFVASREDQAKQQKADNDEEPLNL